ncbi:MAG: hypothetical protein K0R36_2443 [Chryseobacterium sp.]|jgi:glycosyltransferase involved in cell wall biosynthesis|nr:hypothetical protein [Chryseobacterium sp.]
MEKIKIAIATNGRFKPMGSFSRNYIEFLPFDKIVLFGGFIPYFYMGTSLRQQKLIRYWYSFISLKNQRKLNSLIKNRFKKILRNEKIDCVLAEFMNTGSAIREACEELNIPIVTNVLGYEVHKKEIVKSNWDEYEKLAKYKSLVIPVAKNMIPKLKEFGFQDNQIIFSPLGARDEFFNINPDYHSQTFIAIGRFAEMKSPLSTIKAFHKVLQKFPKAKLIFAGEGELFEETKNLVTVLKIENSVDFPGWISQEQQMELLAKSAIFVQHSITTKIGDAEGTPVAILEASAAGLAVVSTKHGGIIDTVIDGETGFLVDENDWENMGEKMIHLLESPSLIQNFGKNGKKFIYKNFSMRKHIEEVEKAIRKAVTL